MRQVFLFFFLITFSNASSQEENHEDFSEVSGYIGSFVKSSSLGANKDSYGTLNFSGILSHKPHKDVVLSLGVFGALALLSDPKENIKDYPTIKWHKNSHTRRQTNTNQRRSRIYDKQLLESRCCGCVHATRKTHKC